MPQQAIIDGFRGKLDFYEWRGIPCCRRWPQFKATVWPQAVIESQNVFKVAARGWLEVSSEVRAAYASMSTNSGYSPRDLFVAMYITNMYRNPISWPLE